MRNLMVRTRVAGVAVIAALLLAGCTPVVAAPDSSLPPTVIPDLRTPNQSLACFPSFPSCLPKPDNDASVVWGGNRTAPIGEVFHSAVMTSRWSMGRICWFPWEYTWTPQPWNARPGNVVTWTYMSLTRDLALEARCPDMILGASWTAVDSSGQVHSFSASWNSGDLGN